MKNIYLDSKKISSELREYTLNKNEVEKILSDHSRFHPTPNQMIILKDLASKLSYVTGLDATLIEGIYIDAIIKRQMEDHVFHFELEKSLPQIRLMKTMRVRDLIRSEFEKLFADPEVIDPIMDHVNEIMEYYLKKYASREVNQNIKD